MHWKQTHEQVANHMKYQYAKKSLSVRGRFERVHLVATTEVHNTNT